MLRSLYGGNAVFIKGEARKAHTLRLKVKNKGSQITYGEWFNKWISIYKKNSVKASTLQCYIDYYRCPIAKYFSDVRLSDITEEKIQLFYNDLADKDYSINSIKIIKNIIACSLKQACKLGMISKDPSVDVALPRAKQKKDRMALTVDEQKTFLKYARNSYLYYFFAFMMRTGLRNGELRGLKWEDIDEDRGMIHIRRTMKYSGDKGYYTDLPKTKTSIRDIPLTDDMMDIIRLNNEDKSFSHSSEYVFSNSRGKVLGREIVQKEINRTLDSIKNDGIRFNEITAHVLRHTFATRAIEAGMEPQVLKTILGHSSLAVTMDIYSHVMFDVKKNEMNKISAAFRLES